MSDAVVAADDSKNTNMNLINAIESLMGMRGDSNQMGITLHPENGWGTNYGKHDLEDGAVEIISKDQLEEWAL